MNSSPIPCQPKISSTNTEPTNSRPKLKAMNVADGISAVRSAWRRSAVRARQALGARRAHVVGAEHVEHRAALVAADDRDLHQDERQRRQHEVLDAVDGLREEAALLRRA